MNILIPVLSGSEIRQFFLSNIVSNLIDNGNIIFSITKFNNPNLIDELIKCDSRIKILHHIVQPIDGTKFSYIRYLLDEVFDKKYERWRYSPKSQLSGFKSFVEKLLVYLLRLPAFYKLALIFERKWMKQLDTSELEALLNNNKIEKVVVSNARFLYYPELLIACAKLNIPVDVVYHSNKEVFAQPRINFNYNMYGMWNAEMLERFVNRYPNLKSKCRIIGNSHFTYLYDNDNIIPFEDFINLFNIENKSLIILYTAAGVIVKNEMLIVQWINDFIQSKGINFKIIVRKNPMDVTDAWNEYFDDKTNIFIQTPKWVMDYEKGINFTKQDDLIEFKSLLTYMSLCVNLPSTLTLECAIKRKPIINISFEFPGVEVTTNNGKLSQFWNAPYYLPYHEFDFVLPTFNIKQLEEQLERCISTIKIYSDYEKCVNKILGDDNSQTLAKIQDFIIGKL